MKMNRIIPVILVIVVLVTGSLVNAYSLNTSGKLRIDSKKNLLASRAEYKPGNTSDNTIFDSYKGTTASSDVIRMDAYNGSDINPYYFYSNAIGSTTAVTDANGQVVERYKYGLYGMPTFMDAAGNVIPMSAIGNNILFQGREYEPETNFYYFRARHLDPIMGRFLSTDPMGYRDSMNLYQAFNQNPVNFVDPFGLIFSVEQVNELMRIRRDQGPTAAKNWINQNDSFTYRDKAVLHMKLLVGVFDPEKVEAEKYKTNWWTVMWDTIDGVGYDVAGRTYDKLADAALNRNSGSFFSFMFDLATMGGGGGLLKHYIPIGINFLKGKFPVLNKSVGELVKKGAEKVKSFVSKRLNSIFGKARATNTVPGGGLTAHEVAGGHTVARHVGKTEMELSERLAEQRRIPAASTFYDLEIAESAVSEAIAAEQSNINTWLEGNNIRFVFSRPVSNYVGISLRRGATTAIKVSNVRIVLIRDPTMSTGYRIITAYPE